MGPSWRTQGGELLQCFREFQEGQPVQRSEGAKGHRCRAGVSLVQGRRGLKHTVGPLLPSAAGEDLCSEALLCPFSAGDWASGEALPPSWGFQARGWLLLPSSFTGEDSEATQGRQQVLAGV